MTARVDTGIPHDDDIDALIRAFESYLRAWSRSPRSVAELMATATRWSQRVGAAAPDLLYHATDVLAALPRNDDDATSAHRVIPEVMRLLARMRSEHTTPSTRVAERHADRAAVAPDSSIPIGNVVSPRPRVESPSLPAKVPIGRKKPAATKIPRPAKTSGGGTTGRGRASSNGNQGLQLSSSITEMLGFRKSYGAPLRKLGIRTIEDLLFHFPRRHVDFSHLKPIAELRPGEDVTVEAFVLRCEAVGPYGRPGRRVEAVFGDTLRTIKGIWFGQEWRAKQLLPGTHLYVSGKVAVFNGRLQFTHPDYEEVSDEASVHTGRLVPVYPLSGDLSGKWLRARAKWAVDVFAQHLPDPLPQRFLQRWQLPPMPAAVAALHFPEDEAEERAAKRRLGFEHLLQIVLGLLWLKREWQRQSALSLLLSPSRLDECLAALPFRLTTSQRQAVAEVLHDVGRPIPMLRQLHGDVGSGKTVVAALAMLAAVESGDQAALMAPTEVLAEQHFQTLTRLFETLNPLLGVALITGSLSETARQEAWAKVKTGQVSIVVGTHALIQEEGVFSQLALVVIDELHRFGVQQRFSLVGKGKSDTAPHVLTMTATLIPRSFEINQISGARGPDQQQRHAAADADDSAIVDVSFLDKVDLGRSPVRTVYVGPRAAQDWLRYEADRDRRRVYTETRTQVAQGRQVFVVCPLIEENEELGACSVLAELRHLSEQVFADLRVALLHGRMKAAEKDDVMRQFRDGALDVLVSTAVIEVGVDIPNATVMIIESAERFGLAQLHQLRGRVGRGVHEAVCYLFPTPDIDDVAIQRLVTVQNTADGFTLARYDRELRHEGDLFGEEQSGRSPLSRFVGYADMAEVRRAALELVRTDPDLRDPEYQALRIQVKTLLDKLAGEAGRADATDLIGLGLI